MMSDVKKFQTKPVAVDAMQYTESSRDALIAWCNPGHRSIDDDGAEYELEVLRLQTPNGCMLVHLSDWVVKDHCGQFRPWRPDAFHGLYEPRRPSSDLAEALEDDIAKLLFRSAVLSKLTLDGVPMQLGDKLWRQYRKDARDMIRARAEAVPEHTVDDGTDDRTLPVDAGFSNFAAAILSLKEKDDERSTVADRDQSRS